MISPPDTQAQVQELRRRLQSLLDAAHANERKLDRYFVGLDYRMNRIVAFSLDLNHQRMRTEPVGFGYKENSVRLAIRASM